MKGSVAVLVDREERSTSVQQEDAELALALVRGHLEAGLPAAPGTAPSVHSARILSQELLDGRYARLAPRRVAQQLLHLDVRVVLVRRACSAMGVFFLHYPSFFPKVHKCIFFIDCFLILKFSVKVH